MKHNMPARHPPCLSRRDCGINVALPTHFNSDRFVSCQSDLLVLAVRFGPQRGWAISMEQRRVEYKTLYPIMTFAQDLKCKKLAIKSGFYFFQIAPCPLDTLNITGCKQEMCPHGGNHAVRTRAKMIVIQQERVSLNPQTWLDYKEVKQL